MKPDAARALGAVRRFCQIADKTTPRWVRILFASSVGALLLVRNDQFGQSTILGNLKDYYIAVNIVVLASTAYIIGTRVYREYGHRRGTQR